MKSVKLIVQGRVQRVGYRNYIFQKVCDYLGEIRGYVQNMANGDVLIEVVGDDQDISTLIKFAHKGPLLAKVNRIDITELSNHDLDQHRDFSIRY